MRGKQGLVGNLGKCIGCFGQEGSLMHGTELSSSFGVWFMARNKQVDIEIGSDVVDISIWLTGLHFI